MAQFPRNPIIGAALCAIAAGGLAAGPAQADEYARHEWMALDTVGLAGVSLNRPHGWRPADLVMVIAYDGAAWPFVARAPLISALLDAGASVVEVAGSVPADGAGVPGAALPQLVQTLRAGGASGPIVLLGHGRWGEAALATGQGYSAYGSLGPSRPEFHIGTAARVAPQRWEVRVAQICGALAWAQGAGATPVRAIPPDAAIEPRCSAGLMEAPQRGAVAALR